MAVIAHNIGRVFSENPISALIAAQHCEEPVSRLDGADGQAITESRYEEKLQARARVVQVAS
jgi:hypothetical protein